jgi:hypothetical protein
MRDTFTRLLTRPWRTWWSGWRWVPVPTGLPGLPECSAAACCPALCHNAALNYVLA